MPEVEQQPTVATAFRRWFISPPRAHGEALEGRAVGFLELFYDLVFVVLVAQIAHTLAGDVSWVGFRNFAIVFALIWIAWINGSFYHELHGREDGRSRTYIFVQMALLVIASVYVAHASDSAEDGRRFAIVYSILLAFITWQWFGVRRYDTAKMAALTTRYVAGISITTGLVIVSAIVNDVETRLIIWGCAIVFTVFGAVMQVFRRDPELEEAFQVTESMSERFGLFTIIVLGEVVVGVAEGLSSADRGGRTIATGLLALMVGFGFWWNYFDFVGLRAPKPGTINRALWNYGHFPLWLSIATAGAGMVSLVEHAVDSRTPANTAWLITGAIAGIALSLGIINLGMPEHEGNKIVPYSLMGAAVAALALGAIRPTPIVLAGLLFVTFSGVWVEAFIRHARAGIAITDG